MPIGRVRPSSDYVHRELDRVHAPRDLVQHFSLKAVDKAASRDRATALMRGADLVLVTAGPGNVLAAYSSGTPALGVGRGNVPVIVDATADLDAAAGKIALSKCFDHATSCSSENALLIDETVYEAMLGALAAQGGYLVSPAEKAQLQETMWSDGTLNRAVVAQSVETICRIAGLQNKAAVRARFLMVEESGVGLDYPFSGEKLSPVLTLYRYAAFDDALKTLAGILDHQGKGHSCGIHSNDERHILGARPFQPGGPRAGEPGARHRERRRLRQRSRFHPVDGRRHVGRKQHLATTSPTPTYSTLHVLRGQCPPGNRLKKSCGEITSDVTDTSVLSSISLYIAGGDAPGLARRETRAYREYSSDEQRSQAGCSAGRM